MSSNIVQEAAAMGRVTVQVKLANNRDVQMLEGGAMPADQVRRVSLEGTVDSSANWLVLPTAVADQLGLPMGRPITVTYGDRRAEMRGTAVQVELELLGRKGTFRAILEPQRTNALIGAIVLEDLDLLVDCKAQRVVPRDPKMMTAEVE
jgi:predicted aspartyl protease